VARVLFQTLPARSVCPPPENWPSSMSGRRLETRRSGRERLHPECEHGRGLPGAATPCVRRV